MNTSEWHYDGNIYRSEGQEPERRKAADNRALTAILCDSIRGRRNYGRRRDDRYGYLFDWHDPRLFWLTLGTLLLCSIDAILTLHILGRGGVELNHFMAVLINTDIRLFAGVKMVVTGVGLVCLVAFAKLRIFRVFKVSHFLYLAFSLYLILIGYEIVLLSV